MDRISAEKNFEILKISGNKIKLNGPEGKLWYILSESGNFDELSDNAFIGLIVHELAHYWSPDISEEYNFYANTYVPLRNEYESLHNLKTQEKKELRNKIITLERRFDCKEIRRRYNQLENDTDNLAILWGFKEEIVSINNERNDAKTRVISGPQDF